MENFMFYFLAETYPCFLIVGVLMLITAGIAYITIRLPIRNYKRKKAKPAPKRKVGYLIAPPKY